MSWLYFLLNMMKQNPNHFVKTKQIQNNAKSYEYVQNNPNSKKDKLEDMLEKIMLPKGIRISSHSIPVQVRNQQYILNLKIDRPDKESIRLVFWPEDWKKNIDIKKIDLYIITPWQSRFEYDEFYLFKSTPDNIVNYVTSKMDYEGQAEKIVNKNANIFLDVLKKLGIKKEDILEVLDAINPDIFPAYAKDVYLKKKALEEGNLELKSEVYCKKISFNGYRLDLSGIQHTKAYEIIIKEGEKAIALIMIDAQLVTYINIGFGDLGFYKGNKEVFGITEKYIIKMNPKLFESKEQ